MSRKFGVEQWRDYFVKVRHLQETPRSHETRFIEIKQESVGEKREQVGRDTDFDQTYLS